MIHRAVVTALVLCCTAVLPAADTAIDLEASRAKLPPSSVPASCGMQLKGPYTTEADLDAMKALGIKFVRRGFHWEGIEKEKGVFDFSGNDAVMDLIRPRGFRVLGVLVFGNKHYPKVVEPEGRAAFARYAAALAERYKDDDVMWEIWNEPNTRTFWGSQGGGKKGNTDEYAQQYVELIKAVVPAIRAVDPDACIIGGSTSNLWSESYNWCGFCFARGALTTGIDAWSVHPYSKLPEEYFEAYGTVRDLMEKHGGPRDFPIMNSERGFPTAKAEGFAGGDPAKKEEIQAWLLARQQLVDLALGTHGTIYYEWKNEKEGFGIYNGDKPNLAHQAYATLIKELDGLSFAERIETEQPYDYVMAFTGPDGTRKLAVWTGASEGKKLETTIPHPVTVKVDATGEVVVVDMTGKASTLPVVDGTITITLDGGPQYVTVKARP